MILHPLSGKKAELVSRAGENLREWVRLSTSYTALRESLLGDIDTLESIIDHYEKTLRAYASPGSFGFGGERLVAERALRGIAPDGSVCLALASDPVGS